MVALPPLLGIRRYASTFPGEPAGSGFDWHFTLTTAHPLTFQRRRFGPPRYHPSFILAMVRSPGSGHKHDKRPIQTRFRYGSCISGLTRQCL